MKTILFFMIIAILTLGFYSCSQRNKAVEEYCECYNSSLNDSIITVDEADSIGKICYDSIIDEKFELTDDVDFIDGFDSIQEIKDLRMSVNNKIVKNIENILLKYQWTSEVDFSDWTQRTYMFQGKVFTQIVYAYYYKTGDWYETNRWTGNYEIEVDSGGKTYVTITYTDDNSKAVVELNKNKKNRYYLKTSRNNIFWSED